MVEKFFYLLLMRFFLPESAG